MKLQQRILVLLVHDLSQQLLVDSIRITLHDDAHHDLASPLLRITQVVHVEVALLLEPILPEEEQAEVDEDLHDLATILTEVLEHACIYATAKEVLE